MLKYNFYPSYSPFIISFMDFSLFPFRSLIFLNSFLDVGKDGRQPFRSDFSNTEKTSW